MQKESIREYIFEKSPDYERARVVFLEVQFSLLDENSHPYSFKYFGGTAFAIDPHHVITALHVVTPDPEWYKEKGTPENAVWQTTLIKERNVSNSLPTARQPHEFDRWNMGPTEYRTIYEDMVLDIAVLSSTYSHLPLPVSFNALGYGRPVYTVDIKNAFETKVFDGTSWLSDESDGVFYDTDCYANFGFSGGPVLGIHQNPRDIDIIFIDRHAALVGVLISDAGKSVMNIRNISRFVSVGAIFDHLNKFHPNWWEKMSITRSTFESEEEGSSAWDEQDEQDGTKVAGSPLRYMHSAPHRSTDSKVKSETTRTATIPGPPHIKNWKCPVYKSGLPLQYR